MIAQQCVYTHTCMHMCMCMRMNIHAYAFKTHTPFSVGWHAILTSHAHTCIHMHSKRTNLSLWATHAVLTSRVTRQNSLSSRS